MKIIRKLVLAAALCLVIGGNLHSQTFGSFDLSVNARLRDTGWPAIAALQPDGKIIVVGQSGENDSFFRLDANGTKDASFRPATHLIPQLFYKTGFRGLTVRGLAVQADGKIVIGGTLSVTNVSSPYVARLNPNGSLDRSFQPELDYEVLHIISVTLQSGGGVLVDEVIPLGEKIFRLNADGSLDVDHFYSSAVPNIHLVAVQPDGKILVTGINDPYSFSRLNEDGTQDNSFTPMRGFVRVAAVQPDGKIVISGDFTEVDGQPANAIARLNSDGTLDAGFNADYINQYSTYFIDLISALAIQPDGKILVAFSKGSSTIHRINSDGSIDATFASSIADSYDTGEPTVNEILLQPDAKILIAGEFDHVDGQIRYGVARLNGGGYDSGAGGTAGSILYTTYQPSGLEPAAIGFYDAAGGYAGTIAFRRGARGTIIGVQKLNIVVVQDNGNNYGAEINFDVHGYPTQIYDSNGGVISVRRLKDGSLEVTGIDANGAPVRTQVANADHALRYTAGLLQTNIPDLADSLYGVGTNPADAPGFLHAEAASNQPSDAATDSAVAETIETVCDVGVVSLGIAIAVDSGGLAAYGEAALTSAAFTCKQARSDSGLCKAFNLGDNLVTAKELSDAERYSGARAVRYLRSSKGLNLLFATCSLIAQGFTSTTFDGTLSTGTISGIPTDSSDATATITGSVVVQATGANANVTVTWNVDVSDPAPGSFVDEGTATLLITNSQVSGNLVLPEDRPNASAFVNLSLNTDGTVTGTVTLGTHITITKGSTVYSSATYPTTHSVR